MDRSLAAVASVFGVVLTVFNIDYCFIARGEAISHRPYCDTSPMGTNK